MRNATKGKDKWGFPIFLNNKGEEIAFPDEFSQELIDDVMGNVVMCDKCGMFYPEWYSEWTPYYYEEDTGFGEYMCESCANKDEEVVERDDF